MLLHIPRGEMYSIPFICSREYKSQFVEQELAFASSQGAWIVPIVIGSPELPQDIQQWIGNYKHISMEPTEENFAWVVDILDDVVKKKIENETGDSK